MPASKAIHRRPHRKPPKQNVPITDSLVRLSSRSATPIAWLWADRLPLGKVSLLVGDPGSGKSFLALDIAARASRGEGVPPEPGLGQPARVLLLAADDDVDDTILPRLNSAGADLRKIALLPSLVKNAADDSSRLLSLVGDLQRLREALDEWRGCKLIIIDPISAYLGGVDGNNNVSVRQVLLELASLAREKHAAILLLSHQRKQWAASVLHRAIGSLAFTAVARVVLMVEEDPAQTGRRFLLPVKMTLQPAAEGRAFHIKEGRLNWEPGLIPLTAEELAHLNKNGSLISDTQRETAEWLKAELLTGRQPAEEILKKAAARRIPRKLLWAAKKKAGVQAIKDGKQQKWFWELPQPWNPLSWLPPRPAFPMTNDN
jgi:hypothetical protein